MITIMTVCGMGLGSSLLASMSAERALTGAGIAPSAFRVETSDIGSARRADVDVYLTTSEFAQDMQQWEAPVVVVTNVFDEQEIGAGLLPVVQPLL